MSVAQLSHFPPGQKDGLAGVSAIPDVQKQTILDYLKAFGLASELTEAEKLQFIEIAQAFKLNPFNREIHVAVFGEGESRRMSIVVGYETYLRERSEPTSWMAGTSLSTVKARTAQASLRCQPQIPMPIPPTSYPTRRLSHRIA